MIATGSALIVVSVLVGWLMFSLPDDTKGAGILGTAAAYARHFGLRLSPYLVGAGTGIAMAEYPIFGARILWVVSGVVLCLGYTLWQQGPKGPSSAANNGIDPLAVADVYLKHGRVNEAIAALHEGIKSCPEREDLVRRLTEIQKRN